MLENSISVIIITVKDGEATTKCTIHRVETPDVEPGTLRIKACRDNVMLFFYCESVYYFINKSKIVMNFPKTYSDIIYYNNCKFNQI